MNQSSLSKFIALACLLLTLFGVVYVASSDATPKQIDIGARPHLASISEAVSSRGFVRVPIFIYHSVRPYVVGESAEQDRYDITPELLEKQLLYLQGHGYVTITLDQLASYFKNGATLPAMKPVILTFDDGWENQYVHAFPLLKKYNMVGTFYVFTNPISKNDHFLTWDQLREMDDAGMTIASHTLSHPYLDKLSPEELRREMTDSKKVLEKELGKPALHFATPFGYSSEVVSNSIKNAGYATGRIIDPDTYQSEGHLLKLRGTLVTDNFEEFTKLLDY